MFNIGWIKISLFDEDKVQLVIILGIQKSRSKIINNLISK